MTAKRQKSGIITGVLGLCCNVVLAVAKVVVGLVTGSVSIATDAANNISDSGASAVTITSFVMADKQADKEHPFGHGRYEYLASFIIGIIIMVVSIEFAIESIKRIITPKSVQVSLVGIIVLAVSILVKLFMFLMYRAKGKKLSSDALAAAAVDSLFDCVITLSVLISFVLSKYISFNFDGYCGLFVATLVFFGGTKVVLSTVNKLLGNGSDPLLTQKIYDVVLEEPQICGAHDLSVHDYGPNKRLGSIHAEFDKELSITQAHKIIDAIEKKVEQLYNVELCIHVDPIDLSDSQVNNLRSKIRQVLMYYHNASIHELCAVHEQKKVSFHLKLPQKYLQLKQTIHSSLAKTVQAELPDYSLEIEFDIIYK